MSPILTLPLDWIFSRNSQKANHLLWRATVYTSALSSHFLVLKLFCCQRWECKGTWTNGSRIHTATLIALACERWKDSPLPLSVLLIYRYSFSHDTCSSEVKHGSEEIVSWNLLIFTDPPERQSKWLIGDVGSLNKLFNEALVCCLILGVPHTNAFMLQKICLTLWTGCSSFYRC